MAVSSSPPSPLKTISPVCHPKSDHILWRNVIYVYIIAWSAVVLGINSKSKAGSNFHEAKPSEISCITSAINP